MKTSLPKKFHNFLKILSESWMAEQNWPHRFSEPTRCACWSSPAPATWTLRPWWRIARQNSPLRKPSPTSHFWPRQRRHHCHLAPRWWTSPQRRRSTATATRTICTCIRSWPTPTKTRLWRLQVSKSTVNWKERKKKASDKCSMKCSRLLVMFDWAHGIFTISYLISGCMLFGS